jgi:tripartite-type tricarboxylate transporter receptor subunit TctC
MTLLSRRSLLAASGAALATPLAAPALGQGNWPSRPIQLLVPWGAGGGTDATARIVGSLLERGSRPAGECGEPHGWLGRGRPFRHRDGAAGWLHHRHDHGGNHHDALAGLTQLNPGSYTPLALMNSDPPGVQVKADSPYQDIKALADAIKARPAGTFKASGTGQGGIWHLALVGWLQAMGLRGDHVRWVPSNGAAPAMQELAAGGVDIVTCSVPEARAMLDAGRAKALAIMAPERNPMFAQVPTLNETLGINYSVGAWRGIAGPRGLPAPIAQRYGAALRKVYDSTEFKEFMTQRGFGTVWQDANGFGSFMAEGDRAMGEAMRGAGLARG